MNNIDFNLKSLQFQLVNKITDNNIRKCKVNPGISFIISLVLITYFFQMYVRYQIKIYWSLCPYSTSSELKTISERLLPIYMWVNSTMYFVLKTTKTCTVKPVLRGHLWDKEKVTL